MAVAVAVAVEGRRRTHGGLIVVFYLAYSSSLLLLLLSSWCVVLFGCNFFCVNPVKSSYRILI